jgi:hypothetical protein
VVPVYFALFALVSLPYVRYVAPVIENWTKAVPPFRYSELQYFSRYAPEHLQLPTCRTAFLGHRELSRRRAVLPRLFNEQVGISREDERDCELGSLCPLPSLAGGANLANDRAGAGVWFAHGAPQGSLGFLLELGLMSNLTEQH